MSHLRPSLGGNGRRLVLSPWAALMPLLALFIAAPGAAPAHAAGPSLVLTRTIGPPTTRVAATGAGFQPNEDVDLAFDTDPLVRTTADDVGSFRSRVVVPGEATPGSHTVTATGESSGL